MELTAARERKATVNEHAILYTCHEKGVRGRKRLGKAGLDAKGT